MIALFPKPRVLAPKLERLPRSLWMTIAAGFRADGGVVLAADSQETIPDYLKTQTSKFAVFQRKEQFRFALTGAGGADMIEMIYQAIMDRFYENRKWDYITAERVIREVVYQTQRRHVLPYPSGERPNFQLLMALQMKGDSVRLLKTMDTTVRRVEDFACVGDIALAHYAAGEIEFSEMPVCFARSFAIYMISLVKAYSPNCGKRTEVVVFYDDWDGEMLKQQFIQAEEFHIGMIAALAHTLTINSFAHRDTNESLQESLEHLKEHVLSYRKWEIEHSGDNCKLTDQLMAKKTMIRVGQYGLTESKASAKRRRDHGKTIEESEPEK